MAVTKPVESVELSTAQRLFVLLQHLLPQHLLSAIMYRIARCEQPAIKNLIIEQIMRYFDISLDDALIKDPKAYKSFNAFFTRELEASSRPVNPQSGTIISPVDGAVSQAGVIDQGHIFQAKGRSFSTLDLLGGDQETASHFDNGSFATIYLSPRDYHRIHMPIDGRLLAMTHVPGKLFSVNETTTQAVPALFARNERVINLFETAAGPVALIMVGAIFVGSMDTVWAGTVTPVSQRVSHWDYQKTGQQPVILDKGDEMGRFNMGSTVILLFGENRINLDSKVKAGERLKMGESIAQLLHNS